MKKEKKEEKKTAIRGTKTAVRGTIGPFICAKVSVAANTLIELIESKYDRERSKPQLSTISRSSAHIFAKNDSWTSFYLS